MTRFFILCGVVCAVLVAGCDETSKACYEEGDRTMKQRVSACGELCEKEDAKGCEKQVELANAQCFDKGNAEICDWMCSFATMGNDLYCKQAEALKAAK